MKTKICSKCKIEKGLNEFYLRGKYYRTPCKVCHHESCVEYKNDNKEKCRLLCKKWRENNIERVKYNKHKNYEENKKVYLERSKQFRLKYPERFDLLIKRWKSNNKEKIETHRKVSRAIKDGILKKQPCEVCGQVKPIIAHHSDYFKPLLVNWLCPLHHKAEHKRLKQIYG